MDSPPKSLCSSLTPRVLSPSATTAYRCLSHTSPSRVVWLSLVRCRSTPPAQSAAAQRSGARQRSVVRPGPVGFPPSGSQTCNILGSGVAPCRMHSAGARSACSCLLFVSTKLVIVGVWVCDDCRSLSIYRCLVLEHSNSVSPAALPCAGGPAGVCGGAAGTPPIAVCPDRTARWARHPTWRWADPVRRLPREPPRRECITRRPPASRCTSPQATPPRRLQPVRAAHGAPAVCALPGHPPCRCRTDRHVP